jgi:N4-gp56 family major capsid protein
MANEIKSTTTTLNDLLSPIVQEAMFVAQEKSLLRGLVRNFTVSKNTGKVLQVPIYPVSTATALTEADDLTPSAVSTNVANITLAEVGLMTNVSDLSLNYSESNIISDVGRLFGEAIALKIDQDIAALFDDFTTTAIGTGTGDNVTAADVFNAIAKLRTKSVDPSGMVCVLHPLVAHDLKSSITSTFGAPASEMGNEAMRTGLVGNLGGVPVYESAAITSASGVSKGAVFHRDAIGLAIGDDIKIETQRDASARATELVGSATYGVAQLQETYGAEMNFETSL